MDAERAKQIAFQALQLIRMEAEKSGRDTVDTDDWLFSEMDAERGEILEIFAPYGIRAPRLDSAFPDGNSPKDYDRKYFSR